MIQHRLVTGREVIRPRIDVLENEQALLRKRTLNICSRRWYEYKTSYNDISIFLTQYRFAFIFHRVSTKALTTIRDANELEELIETKLYCTIVRNLIVELTKKKLCSYHKKRIKDITVGIVSKIFDLGLYVASHRRSSQHEWRHPPGWCGNVSFSQLRRFWNIFN